MKTLLTTLASLALLLAAGASHANTNTIKAGVNGMVCAFCAQGIERKMRSFRETRDVYVDLKNKVVAVELKEGQTLSHDTVRAAIKDAGYDVVSLENVTESAQQIRAAIRARR